MVQYLLRWQWLLLKRQLFTLPMLVGLGTNVVFQLGILVAALSDPSQYTDNITPFVLYASLMALSQTMNGFSQSLAVASMGLLGIAPINHRSKMAMVLFELTVLSAMNAIMIALGLGVSLMLHGSGPGSLLVMVLVFIAGGCLYAGLAACLATLVSHLLPAKLKTHSGALLSPLMFVLIAVLNRLDNHHPQVVRRFGEFFVSMAQHPWDHRGHAELLLAFAVAGVVLASIPFATGFADVSQRVADASSKDSRTYRQNPAPRGLFRLLVWRERIVLLRGRGLALLPGLAILAFFTLLMPGQFTDVGFIFFGVQMGAVAISGFGTKPLQVYLAPTPLSSFWLRRLVILAVETFVIAGLYLVLESVLHRPITLLRAVDDLALALLGVCGMSFFIFLLPQGRYEGVRAGKGKMTATAVLTTIGSSLVPYVLAGFNEWRPVTGLVLDLGLITGFLWFGPAYLRQAVRFHYPLRP